MKKLLKKIEEHRKLLIGISVGIGILLGFLGEYGLAFLCIFPLLFFSVNSYLADKADIPTYKPVLNKKTKEEEYDNPQDYSSYRAELFNSVRKKKKK